MGNFRTDETPQAILNMSSDDTVAPRTIVVGLMGWNGTGYERIASTNNSLKVSALTLKKLVSNGKSAGDLNLTDANWAISKAWIKELKITLASGTSSDYDVEIFEKDTFLDADKIYTLLANSGDIDVMPDRLYEDQDATNEVHLKITDNDGGGSPIFNIQLRGIELA